MATQTTMIEIVMAVTDIAVEVGYQCQRIQKQVDVPVIVITSLQHWQ